MCGIAGFTGRSNHEVLIKMVNSMVHRGPDDIGHWANESASLGMRRLAIIDVNTGQQPVWDEKENVYAIMNGEIYNYIELRESLLKRGHAFRSHHSDTEVIPHLYEEYGPDFLKQLNGMFAIAIWDNMGKQLLLARDYCGIKPLYFTVSKNSLIFGSEIKAILQHPAVHQRPNFEALNHYFTFKNIPTPLTAFEGIEQLRPGERVIFKNGILKREKWWRLPRHENFEVSEEVAAREIRRLLEDSVRIQMRSDVPFGAYLSGGVDSSSIVALMTKLGKTPVKTFTLAYEDNFYGKSADQSAADRISKLYGTDHQTHVMNHHELTNLADKVLGSFDEPFSGTISTFFLTDLISKHVKVALSGDGADELFGSYLPHRLAWPLFYYPKFKKRWDYLSPEEKLLVEPFSSQPQYLADTYLRGDEAARRMGQYVWDDSSKSLLFTQRFLDLSRKANTEGLIREHYNYCPYRDPLNRALYIDFETILPDQVLSFVDRLSMAHSVEVRPPFLDHRLVEYVFALPGTMKIKGGRVKHILKEAVKDLLPPDLLNRPKEGFVLPVNDWIFSSMKVYVYKVLSPNILEKQGFFNSQYVEKIIEQYYSNGGANHANRIWNLMMFQVWWQRYFGDS